MDSRQRSNKPLAKVRARSSVVYFFTIDDAQPSLHSAVFMRLWSFRGLPQGSVSIDISREDQAWS